MLGSLFFRWMVFFVCMSCLEGISTKGFASGDLPVEETVPRNCRKKAWYPHGARDQIEMGNGFKYRDVEGKGKVARKEFLPFTGTGVLVRPSLVLTSAHNPVSGTRLLSEKENLLFKYVFCSMGYQEEKDGEMILEKRRVVKVSFLKKYDVSLRKRYGSSPRQCLEESLQDDWALFVVERPFSSFPRWRLASLSRQMRESSEKKTFLRVCISGFPTLPREEEIPRLRSYSDERAILNRDYRFLQWGSRDLPSLKGMSGSPVQRRSSSKLFFALHRGEYLPSGLPPSDFSRAAPYFDKETVRKIKRCGNFLCSLSEPIPQEDKEFVEGHFHIFDMMSLEQEKAEREEKREELEKNSAFVLPSTSAEGPVKTRISLERSDQKNQKESKQSDEKSLSLEEAYQESPLLCLSSVLRRRSSGKRCSFEEEKSDSPITPRQGNLIGS